MLGHASSHPPSGRSFSFNVCFVCVLLPHPETRGCVTSPVVIQMKNLGTNFASLRSMVELNLCYDDNFITRRSRIPQKNKMQLVERSYAHPNRRFTEDHIFELKKYPFKWKIA